MNHTTYAFIYIVCLDVKKNLAERVYAIKVNNEVYNITNYY